MTQQADPRLPLVDTSLDAQTTAPGFPAPGTPTAQPAGWPPGEFAAPPSPPVGVGPMPQGPAGWAPGAPTQAPLNTLSWLSVVVAFVASPVAIVLGLVARKQIARTGERGRGLALTGTILGAVFTAIGIATTVLVLVLATTFSASVQATTTPAPVDTAGSPAAPAAPSAPAAPAAPAADDSAGQAQLMAGFVQVGAAADTMSTDLETHRGDLDAMQADFKAYRDAIAQFRTTATTVSLSPAARQKVDAELVPAIDRVLADLDTLSTSSSQSRLSAAADALQPDSQAMVTAATAAVGG
ncbi:DUF4190 domain-containing protein [Actinomycetospora sp. TBRC 11914]|uniref:DUF4190 domain-containing protein n=1 Tax=Actinomycetospora sp. TBRC 11914 TaxID=2729387 RepID=UPI00145FBA71|nr:DUF4190 domain-containing protein [Actinomycetospora sp. TBRC 11914]NMO89281.1 DUF4190 domain-containing protein [Actinomycetospora sp. TBRC 11914]